MANESNDTMNDAISDDWAQALEEQATASAAGDESALRQSFMETRPS